MRVMNASHAGTVIVGAGQAGLQAALSLRAGGYDLPITLIGDEPRLPYQRPPLSKAMLQGTMEPQSLALRADGVLADQQIAFVPGLRIAAIDRTARLARGGGRSFAYVHLVLATGTVARRLPVPGGDLDGVHYLRTLDDALALKAALASARSVVVIGAGFIGLEVAATARKLGCRVDVIEMSPRVMGRAVSTTLSEYAAAKHRAEGVSLHLSRGLAGIEGEGGSVRRVALADGERLRADLVLIGTGAVPVTALAEAAGLACVNGILVDPMMRTSDPAILAIGDCAAHPNPFADGRTVRLESVQNAIDQGKTAAATILGREEPYRAVPWFWSDQFNMKLQMAGLLPAGSAGVLRGDPASDRFSIFHLVEERVVAVESVNRPADHMIGRRLVDKQARLSAAEAADETFDLKAKAAAS
jgi:3-phenylpropionate/trans-cinnamate dioxygenase ferredoxin reductase component